MVLIEELTAIATFPGETLDLTVQEQVAQQGGMREVDASSTMQQSQPTQLKDWDSKLGGLNVLACENYLHLLFMIV